MAILNYFDAHQTSAAVGGDQQGVGDHQAGVRAEVSRQPVEPLDPGPESCVPGDRLVDRADPSDSQWSEGPFRPVLHLKTEEPSICRACRTMSRVPLPGSIENFEPSLDSFP